MGSPGCAVALAAVGLPSRNGASVPHLAKVKLGIASLSVMKISRFIDFSQTTL
jgi:hypothetical protein